MRPISTAKPNLANQAEKDFPKYYFIKEVTYQIPDQKVISNLERMVKDLKKKVVQREKTKREIKTLKKQDKLILRRGNNPRLSGLLVKPKLPGKKVTGTLESHSNGLRFTSTKGFLFIILLFYFILFLFLFLFLFYFLFIFIYLFFFFFNFTF